MPITCSPLLFESNVNYTNENRQKIKARYLASKSKIVDYIERDRLLALAAAEEEENAKKSAAAGKIIKASQSTELGVVAGDSLVPVNQLKGLKKVTVSIAGSDDIGRFLVVDNKGEVHTIAWAEWTAEKGAGSASGDVTKALSPGRNALIFIIHNKQFSFGAGKWSFQANVLGDGKKIWEASGGAPGGGVGIQFWKAVFVDKAPNGVLSIVSPKPSQLTGALPMMKIVNEFMVTNHGTENSAASVVAGGLIDSMIRSIVGFGGSDSGSSSNDSYEEAARFHDWQESQKNFNKYRDLPQ
jgi:hypothetical protein